MADIFTQANAQELLRGKVIWFLGDSNVRASYKDLVWLLQRNSLIDLNSLRMKLERSYMNDHLVKGTTIDRGRSYQEVRRYQSFELGIVIEFMFLTRCITDDLETALKNLKSTRTSPDIVILNSCVWDILRWGPNGVTEYKRNIVELMKILKSCLSPKTLVIWTTTPPIAAEPCGGLIIKQIEFMKHSIRFEVMEANLFVRQEVISHGFDVLDIHYHLLLQIHRRRPDGIHWNCDAVRHITNLILTHIALSWGCPLPGNFKSPIVEKMKHLVPEPLGTEKEKIRELDAISKNIQPGMNENQNQRKNRRQRGRKRMRQMKNNNDGTFQIQINNDDFVGNNNNNFNPNFFNDDGFTNPNFFNDGGPRPLFNNNNCLFNPNNSFCNNNFRNNSNNNYGSNGNYGNNNYNNGNSSNNRRYNSGRESNNNRKWDNRNRRNYRPY